MRGMTIIPLVLWLTWYLSNPVNLEFTFGFLYRLFYFLLSLHHAVLPCSRSLLSLTRSWAQWQQGLRCVPAAIEAPHQYWLNIPSLFAWNYHSMLICYTPVQIKKWKRYLLNLKEGKKDFVGLLYRIISEWWQASVFLQTKYIWFLISRQHNLTGTQRRWALSMDLSSGVILWHKFQVVSFQINLLRTGKINSFNMSATQIIMWLCMPLSVLYNWLSI